MLPAFEHRRPRERRGTTTKLGSQRLIRVSVTPKWDSQRSAGEAGERELGLVAPSGVVSSRTALCAETQLGMLWRHAALRAFGMERLVWSKL